MRISIDDNKLTNFSFSAKDELKKQINNYAELIIKESNLIEYGLREENTNPEITSTIVASASKKSQIHTKKKNIPIRIIIKVLSWISMIFVGAFFDIEKCQSSTICLVVLIISIVIATGTSIIQIVWEELK